MTELMDKALDAVRTLPPDRQDEIARAILELAQADDEPQEIDADHLGAVLEGLTQYRRGERATPAEVEAAFRRFDE